MELSPLWMVTQEPELTSLVRYLQATADEIAQNPHRCHTLTFSRRHLERVRLGFSSTILRGESKLHRLCELVARTFLQGEFEISSVVIGEVEATRERFTLVQKLTTAELFQQTDLDLGNRQLERIRFRHGEQWSTSTLVANFVEYQPAEANPWSIQKITSRIKAEEELWNKVVDEIFKVDSLIQSHKELRHLSRYVKDVFGFKILVAETGAVNRLHKVLQNHRWTSEQLSHVGVPWELATEKLEFLEVKDYLASKPSGWQALKSVVHWWDSTMELQIQPLRNYLRERERLTTESHAGFKTRREQMRSELTQRIPLYGFYRTLLRWLFLSPHEPQPSLESVSIEVID